MSRIRFLIKNNSPKLNALLKKNSAIAMIWVCLVRLEDRLSGNKVRDDISHSLDRFGVDDIKERKRIAKLIWKYRELYLVDPNECFLFGFFDIDDDKKRSFVGNREKELICARINNSDAWKIFSDKWLSYTKFKDYYGRNAILISDNDEKARYVDFMDKNQCAIIKSTKESRGRGIFTADRNNLQEAWSNIERAVANGESVIVEQWVSQSEDMAMFHPESVNTLRFSTFRNDSSTLFLFAALRTGHAGSVVDNGGAGGIFASVDLESGCVITDGFDKQGNAYEAHPDTGIRFKGFHLPDWTQACQLVKSLADVVPEQRYVGWDLAHTENGWIMIEGNSWGQMGIPQISTKKGLRDLVNRTFYKVINGGNN